MSTRDTIRSRCINQVRTSQPSPPVTPSTATKSCLRQSHFQRMVNQIFKELIKNTMEIYVKNTMEIYVDDMLVKSLTRSDHVKNLGEAFLLIRKLNMKLIPEKCTFRVASGKFLGIWSLSGDRGQPCTSGRVLRSLCSRPESSIRKRGIGGQGPICTLIPWRGINLKRVSWYFSLSPVYPCSYFKRL